MDMINKGYKEKVDYEDKGYYEGGHGDVAPRQGDSMSRGEMKNRPSREGALIPSYLDRNDSALKVLHEAITELVDKIQPILGPEPSSARDPGGLADDRPEMSSLSGRLEDQLSQIQSMNNHVRYIRDRVEL